jgi:hypothetical protein
LQVNSFLSKMLPLVGVLPPARPQGSISACRSRVTPLLRGRALATFWESVSGKALVPEISIRRLPCCLSPHFRRDPAAIYSPLDAEVGGIEIFGRGVP